MAGKREKFNEANLSTSSAPLCKQISSLFVAAASSRRRLNICPLFLATSLPLLLSTLERFRQAGQTKIVS